MPAPLFKTGNPGKQKGTLNKTTRELKDTIKMICEDKLQSVYERFEELELKDQARLLCALLTFVIPKKQSVETSKAIEIPKEFNALTYEQLEQIQAIMENRQPTYQVLPALTQIEYGDKPF